MLATRYSLPATRYCPRLPPRAAKCPRHWSLVTRHWSLVRGSEFGVWSCAPRAPVLPPAPCPLVLWSFVWSLPSDPFRLSSRASACATSARSGCEGKSLTPSVRLHRLPPSSKVFQSRPESAGLDIPEGQGRVMYERLCARSVFAYRGLLCRRA
jgi:hypothetical protein